MLNVCPFYGRPALCQGNTVRMALQSLGLRALAKVELGEGKLPRFIFRQEQTVAQPWWFKCLPPSKWENCGKEGGRKKELEGYDQVWFFRPSIKTALQMVSKERDPQAVKAGKNPLLTGPVSSSTDKEWVQQRGRTERDHTASKAKGKSQIFWYSA